MPYVEFYRGRSAALGTAALPIGVHSPGHIADTDEQAREELWPDYKKMRNRSVRERGWPPTSRRGFRARGRYGSLYRRRAGDRRRRSPPRRRRWGSAFALKYSSVCTRARVAHALHRALRPQR